MAKKPEVIEAPPAPVEAPAATPASEPMTRGTKIAWAFVVIVAVLWGLQATDPNPRIDPRGQSASSGSAFSFEPSQRGAR